MSNSEEYKLKIIFLTLKVEEARSLDNQLKRLSEEAQVYPYSDLKRAKKALSEKKYDVVLIDQAVMRGEPAPSFLKGFLPHVEEKINSLTPVIMLGSHDQTVGQLKEIFDMGIKDYLLKPFDFPLVMEKINTLLPAYKKVGNRQLHVETTRSEMVFLAQPEQFLKISEHGGTTLGDKDYEEGEIYYLSSPEIFGEENPSLWARCNFSHKYSNQPGKKESMFTFLAIDAGQLTSIRRWIKEKYVKQQATKWE